MFNFCKIVITERKRDFYVIEPKFKVSVKDSDLMIRGGDFYAVFDQNTNLWRTDVTFVYDTIDAAVMEEYKNCPKREGSKYVPLLMDDSDSGMVDKWNKYCQKQLRDNFKQLNPSVVFNNTEISRKDYASRKLPYNLNEGSTESYDELMNTLYSEDERRKLEWAMGSIIAGDSKDIQKFIVLYGDSGTGKSTFLHILEKLFEGYTDSFNSKALGAAKDFALDSFKKNPLISIEHDGVLSKIEDNTLLNSLVSHETMEINPKYGKKFSMKFNSMLFMGSNEPVKITGAKSGIIRRLIDVYPTGKLIRPVKKYNALMKSIDFELGAIAYHVLQVYNKLGPNYYDGYVPLKMISETNDFYDFMEYYYDDFASKEFVVLQDVWELYRQYNEMAGVRYPLPRRQMSAELATYFEEHKEAYYPDRDTHYRNVYFGFKKDKFVRLKYDLSSEEQEHIPDWLKFDSRQSVFDIVYSDCTAQYATPSGTPERKWSECNTKLSDINTSKLHWVKVNPPHIVIDFDLKDDSGNKSLIKNIEAASKFPPTYAELSKSGHGIHLHYIYDGDTSKLSPLYSDNIEIKVFSGKSSLRRMLTKCNELQIATINSGLPTVNKEDKKMIDNYVLKTETALINRIEKCLRKEVHPDTKSNIDFIYRSLEDAYNSDLSYDVSTLFDRVYTFACCSTHQAANCRKLVQKMHFKSKDREEFVWKEEPFKEDAPIAFFDIEVFPNLFLINWKFEEDKKCKRMINPTPLEVAELFKYKLIGFNNLRYDNIILLARARGASIGELYQISKRIIHGTAGVVSKEISYTAKSISYADLYDISTKKQSLKKWEIELHIHHKELGYNWDEPIPEDKWVEVAEYCDNDVFATQAVYNAIQGDFTARKILAVISGLTVNTPDNQHSAQIIFGNDKNHKKEFVYTDLSKLFPGYKFEAGKSTYLGEEVGEGGAVRAKPGMYEDVWVFDIASQHPHSIKELNLFGDKYTKKFYDLVELRISIKHGDLEKARQMFDGKLIPYLEDETYLKAIAQALKIVINSVYGLTSAHFDNPFKDPRNVDNIVAKRGALFMLTLKKELEERGVEVIHIKTDSIKVPNPSEETKKFICDFGKKYGYTFEIEHIYQKFCLVNDAVYIAKYKEPEVDKETGKETWWDATGKEFQRPYVYKTLFSHEDIDFYDLCETRSVQTAMYLDYNNEGEDDPNKRTFVGRVGLFIPVKSGGGTLVRESKDKEGNVKYTSVNDTKGYKWIEAEDVGPKGIKLVDRDYHNSLVSAAKKHIEEFGDFESFIA